jgi:FtsP/CotA-like multicopper oxidase with cupredoxin domain
MIEVEGAGGPIAMYLNGQSFAGQLTETRALVGSTEDWYFINLTPDTHPMHLHLVQFQIVKRMEFDAEKYLADWTALNGQVPIANDKTPTNLAIDSYLTGQVVYPKPNELAWKDTVQSPKGWITVVRVRFAPQSAPLTGPKSPTPGKNLYPFDPTTGPGYVWHCHIIDHEDNEMMRPYVVVK